MFKRVYEKTHLAAITLAELRLIDDHINDRGAMMLTTIMLPPHIQVVTPTSGKVNSTKIHTLGARGPGNQQKHLEYIVGSG